MSPNPKPHMIGPVETAPSRLPGAVPARTGSLPADARLNADEYHRWLLPTERRDAVERMIHRLSLAAGVLAVTLVSALLWFLT